jgi:hypothetical protein
MTWVPLLKLAILIVGVLMTVKSWRAGLHMRAILTVACTLGIIFVINLVI